MTDKELRRISRGDLIEIIYQYQQRERELTTENTALKASLEARTTKIAKAGSIAEAALSLNHVFEAAQAAADQYLEEVRASTSDIERLKLLLIQEARQEAADILRNAKNKCDAMLHQAEMECTLLREQARHDRIGSENDEP